MTMEQKMPLLDLQFAFFFANPPINLKFDEFSVDVRRKPVFKDNDLDLQTFIFPLPSDVPQDIPRCQITATNNRFGLSISGMRCDINLNIEQAYSTETFNKIIFSIMQVFKEHNIEIIRVGYITRYIIKSKFPDQTIKESFLKINEPNVSEPFVRFVFKGILNNISYNDLYQIELGKQNNFTTGKQEDVILISQDFNSSPENINVIDERTLDIFIQNIPKEKIQSYIAMLSK